MTDYSNALPTILNAIAPIFILIVLGGLLIRLRVIDRHFVDVSSRLVFQVTLPILMFLGTAKTRFDTGFDPLPVYYAASATIICFTLTWAIAWFFIRKGEDLGPFVQGAFRSNFVIIGLAVIINLYGETGLAASSVITAVIIPLYNILAVICLAICTGHAVNISTLVLSILKNPLILSVLLGLPFGLFEWHIPELLQHTGTYVADITMPLAVMGIGATLNISALYNTSSLALIASLIRTVLAPLIFTYGAWLMGVRNMNLVILFIVFASPTALASFIMAKGMRANADLAANIVLLSTLFSPFTMGTGLYILHLAGAL